MATVASLKSELARIRRVAGVTAPRTWCMVLEEGEEIPLAVVAKIAEQDGVCIRRTPIGLLRGMRVGNWSYGYVCWHGGAAVIKPDGTLEKVRRQF